MRAESYSVAYCVNIELSTFIFKFPAPSVSSVDNFKQMLVESKFDSLRFNCVCLPHASYL